MERGTVIVLALALMFFAYIFISRGFTELGSYGSTWILVFVGTGVFIGGLLTTKHQRASRKGR
jgi:hypothetical protein